MVRTGGIEPPWEAHTPLKRTRLPISPRPQFDKLYDYIDFKNRIQEQFFAQSVQLHLVSFFFFFVFPFFPSTIIPVEDKRSFIGVRSYRMADGKSFKVNIYRKSTDNGITIRVAYGEMDAYISSRATFAQLDNFVEKAYVHYSDAILDRPFYEENVYIYVFGKKRYLTDDIRLQYNPTYFYVPKKAKSPIPRYKKTFLDYLSVHLMELGDRMGVNLRSWTVQTGFYLSFYGICYPYKHVMKFDYRLLAYTPEVMDAVLIHEIAHTYEIHHNQRYYTIVKMYCPQYDILDRMIDEGKFEGEMDDYVYESH